MKRSRHLPAMAAVLLSAAWAAQAQSTPRYAMTVLAIPAGATHSSAFALDAAGNAMGSVNTEITTTRTCGGDFGNPSVDWLFVRKCPVLNTSTQEATWPAGRGATQSPLLGASNFITVGVSSNGTKVGVRGTAMGHELGEWDFPNNITAAGYGHNFDTALSPWRIARVSNGSGDSSTTYKSVVIKKGDTISNLPFAPSTGLRFRNFIGRQWWTQVRGITGTGKVLVNALGDGDGSGSGKYVPHLFADGRYTRLNDSLAPGKLMGTAVNDAGLVVGMRMVSPVDAEVTVPVVPVRWQNGTPIELSGTDLRGYIPEAVNASGQVLLQREIRNVAERSVHEAAVWLNGGLTPLTLPPDDGTLRRDRTGRLWGVIATTMNARGDVAGCGSFPFVWRDGMMHDLNKLLASTGLQTPNGRPLSCVSAMNDQGVLLANYLVSAPGKLPLTYGWVRLTPLP
jgi:hypothetical protein